MLSVHIEERVTVIIPSDSVFQDCDGKNQPSACGAVGMTLLGGISTVLSV